MTTNNHPAHCPVSLDRLHQIREILSKAAAKSDCGNIGYAMADAVKVLDGAIASRSAEPVFFIEVEGDDWIQAGRIPGSTFDFNNLPDGVNKLWASPQPAAVVPDEKPMPESSKMHAIDAVAAIAEVRGWNDCRAAMLQAGNHTEQHLDMVDHSGDANKMVAGNSPVTPDCSCRTCRPVTFTDSRFVVCPECGNKRCPHANDHRNACTGSNEPGQAGSAYPAAPQQEVKS